MYKSVTVCIEEVFVSQKGNSTTFNNSRYTHSFDCDSCYEI